MHTTIAVLLPMACAISVKKEMASLKAEILKENTLDAVFTLPIDLFHPGASIPVCCMIFKTGRKHSDPINPKTFFGYYKEDGFKKRKNLGRVEQIDRFSGKSKWLEIEKEWIELYSNRTERVGYSVTHKVSATDEWACEAYMKTDYTVISKNHFVETVNRYFSYLAGIGKLFDTTFVDSTQYVTDYLDFVKKGTNLSSQHIDVSNWEIFEYSDIFDVQKGFYNKKPDHSKKGAIPFLGASERDNGVTEYYSVKDISEASKTGYEVTPSTKSKMFSPKAVCVTNNGSVGNAFYQPIQFTCSHDVNPLYILDGSFNMYSALFVATIIEIDKYRWAYGRKWRPERMGKSQILLPAKHEGTNTIPDWEYMTKYIQSLPYNETIS